MNIFSLICSNEKIPLARLAVTIRREEIGALVEKSDSVPDHGPRQAFIGSTSGLNYGIDFFLLSDPRSYQKARRCAVCLPCFLFPVGRRAAVNGLASCEWR